MVGTVVFFTVIGIVSTKISEQSLPYYVVFLVVLLPIVVGIVAGIPAGFILKKERSQKSTVVLLVVTILIAAGIGLIFNHIVLPKPVLNFMLIGMAFSATFSNMIPEERVEKIMEYFNSILGIGMIIVILNLGAPLNYHLILGAGLFTAVYIIFRALGKIGGAYFGAKITHSPTTVRKYLGPILLPHSGVSLIFTGIAVSVLSGPVPECA